MYMFQNTHLLKSILNFYLCADMYYLLFPSMQQPKLFDGYKFYLMGDFMPSYKGYLVDLVTAAGGIFLHRKPLCHDQNALSPERLPSQTLIIYSLEFPDKFDPFKRETILSQRRNDAEALASSTGSKAASNTWILDSIAACRLQSLVQ